MARIAPVTYDWDGSEVTTRGQAPARAIRKRRTWGAGGGAPPDTDPPEATWAVNSDGDAIIGTMDEACKTDAGHTPAAARFSLGATHATIASTSWDDSTHFRLTLTTGSRVTDFEAPTVSYTAGALPIEDVAGNALGNISNAVATNNSTFLQGAILLFSLYRASSYVLSGSNITALINEVNGASHATVANPQYVAAGLNSRPSMDLNGTTQYFTGTDAAARSCLQAQNAHHFFAIAQTDNDDLSQALFSIGNPGVSNNGRRSFGISSTTAGRHRDTATNDAAATTTAEGVDGAPTTGATVYEFFGTTTTTEKNNGTIDGVTPGSDLNARAWNPGSMTAAAWAIGAQPSAAGHALFWDGDLAYALLFDAVQSSAPNTPANIRAYLYFLSGLSGS